MAFTSKISMIQLAIRFHTPIFPTFPRNPSYQYCVLLRDFTLVMLHVGVKSVLVFRLANVHRLDVQPRQRKNQLIHGILFLFLLQNTIDPSQVLRAINWKQVSDQVAGASMFFVRK